MQEVFIHVGIEKTGSTSLQSMLCKNEHLFRKNSISYLKAGRESGHHYWLAKALGFKFKEAPVNSRKERIAIEGAKKEINNSRAKKLLLSSEHFDFNVNANNVSNLVSMFGDRKITIVLFLRNQIDYSKSLYLEHLKWTGVNSYEEFIIRTSTKQKRYDYLHRYEMWANSGATVKVLDYDSMRDNLFEEYIFSMGISELMQLLVFPTKRLNKSPSPDMMEFVRLQNVEIAPEKRRKNFEKLFKKISGELPEMLNNRRTPLPDSAKDIFIHQQKNNTKLAMFLGETEDEFLGGSLIERMELYSKCKPIDINPIINCCGTKCLANE